MLLALERMSSASPFVPAVQSTEVPEVEGSTHAPRASGDPKRRRMTEEMGEALISDGNTAVDLPSGAPTAPEVPLDPSPLPASVLQELFTVIAGQIGLVRLSANVLPRFLVLCPQRHQYTGQARLRKPLRPPSRHLGLRLLRQLSQGRSPPQ